MWWTLTAWAADRQPDASRVVLRVDADALARRHFRHAVPTPAELEDAIAVVEDEVTRVRHLADGTPQLLASGPAMRSIALAAGAPEAPAMELSVEAVEQLFDRLCAVALGRPLQSDGMPLTPAFAAALLLLREFMHHLQFAAVTVGDYT